MKLLFIIGGLSVQDGGPAIEIVRLTEQLIGRNGIKITVLCITPKNPSMSLHPDVTYVELKNSTYPSISWIKSMQIIEKYISEADLIFSTGIWGILDNLAIRNAWKSGKPVYLRVCGMLEPYILRRNALRKKLALSLYLKRNLNKSTGIIVNSRPEYFNIKNSGNLLHKTYIIPNGIDFTIQKHSKEHARKNLAIEESKRVLLYLGRIHPKKGLHVLLETLIYYPVFKKDILLVIAGEFSDGQYRDRIMDLITTGGLQSNVKLSGLVAGIDKEYHYSAADCFILPSYSEGLPNAVLEALSYELPSIVTKECNIPEVEEYRAGKIVDLNHASIATSLEWFVSNSDDFKESSRNARTLVQGKFSPEHSVNEYWKIIESNYAVSRT